MTLGKAQVYHKTTGSNHLYLEARKPIFLGRKPTPNIWELNQVPEGRAKALGFISSSLVLQMRKVRPQRPRSCPQYTSGAGALVS